MSKLAMSMRLFAGAIVYLAEEVSGDSDVETKPINTSPLWLEVGAVQTLTHKPTQFEEKFNECGENGWREGKDVFTLADVLDLKTREVSELYHRLTLGVADPLVADTAQTPFASTDRKVRGWIKIQQRMHTGTDRTRMDIYCEIRIKTEPGIEKKTQEPELELYVLNSSLNSVVIPA